MTLSFAHLRAVNVARCVEGWHHPIDSWSLADWLVALGGEVGEALNIVKKLNRARDGIIGNATGPDQLLDDLADELADAVIYADLLAARFGVLQIRQGTFGDLRKITAQEMQWVAMPGLPSARAPRLLTCLGRLADVVASNEDGKSRTFGAPYLALASLLGSLDLLALAYDIDLGAAVVRKFDATSLKHGMPHRLGQEG